ncbi:MAG: outer membrane lipoprotein carrier protein LolA [Bacteroidetes bacterium]|nr:outer membrane lipoprotein carrier protein LolA [Bacteroidota bacterium]
MKTKMLTLLVILPALLFAQGTNPRTKPLQEQVSDPKAKAILDEVIKKSKTYETIKADFSYKLDNKKNKVNDSYTGNVIIKGEKYRLNVAGQTVIFNNNTTWTFIKSANEVQINSVEENEDAVTPTKIFDGTYLNNFNPKLINEITREGKTLVVIDLTPRKTKSYFKVRVEIDKVNKQIVTFAVYDKNGSTYSYSISKFQTNIKVADSEFVFKAADFPGAEINDMR